MLCLRRFWRWLWRQHGKRTLDVAPITVNLAASFALSVTNSSIEAGAFLKGFHYGCSMHSLRNPSTRKPVECYASSSHMKMNLVIPLNSSCLRIYIKWEYRIWVGEIVFIIIDTSCYLGFPELKINTRSSTGYREFIKKRSISWHENVLSADSLLPVTALRLL